MLMKSYCVQWMKIKYSFIWLFFKQYLRSSQLEIVINWTLDILYPLFRHRLHHSCLVNTKYIKNKNIWLVKAICGLKHLPISLITPAPGLSVL